MDSDGKTYISQFEIEGEEQVRRNMVRGVYGAHGYGVAVEWLERKSAAREAHAQEARLLSDRQAQVAESANQLSERQAKAAEFANAIAAEANQISRHANRLSYWAIGISIVSCVVAVAAVLYGRA